MNRFNMFIIIYTCRLSTSPVRFFVKWMTMMRTKTHYLQIWWEKWYVAMHLNKYYENPLEDITLFGIKSDIRVGDIRR